MKTEEWPYDYLMCAEGQGQQEWSHGRMASKLSSWQHQPLKYGDPDKSVGAQDRTSMWEPDGFDSWPGTFDERQAARDVDGDGRKDPAGA